MVYNLLCSGIEHKTRTVDSSISTEALEQFAEDGYLVLENGIIDEALKGLQQAFDEVITQELEAGGLEDGEFVRDLPGKHDPFLSSSDLSQGPGSVQKQRLLAFVVAFQSIRQARLDGIVAPSRR